MLAAKSLVVWLLILVFAIGNGGVRDGILLKVLPHSAAYTLSGIILIGCVLLVSVVTIRWLGPLSLAKCILIGTLWLALTLVFEFTFALLVRRQDLAQTIQAYRFKDGNILPLVLLAVAIAPTVAAYIRGVLTPNNRWRGP
jgi:hypothetical protein